ncbi:hypothetical protein [Propionicimonas paludicola]|uniref:hypothetical protein n=1 Tax=Propionicimonas paludicola TaxID=185243 RepID=UPI000BF9747D|nr:hypothetical protein [Propionicimonas paludicola]
MAIKDGPRENDVANVYDTTDGEKAWVDKVWNSQGKDGFIVVRSAEGALATRASARGFRPAHSQTRRSR